LIRHAISGVRWRIAAIIFVALLPIVVLEIVDAGRERRAAIEGAGQRLELAWVQTRNAQTRILESTGALLALMGRFWLSQPVSTEACAAALSEIMNDSQRFAGLGIVDPTGVVLCSNPATPPGFSVAGRTFFERARATGSSAVGDFEVGRVTGKPSLIFARPLRDSTGRTVAYAVASLDLGWLGPSLAAGSAMTDAVLLLLDRNGTVLLRQPDHEAWLGKVAGDTPLFAAIQSHDKGTTFSAPGLDGVVRLYRADTFVFDPAAEPIHVVAGVDVAPHVARARRDLATNLGLLATIFLGLLAASGMFGEVLITRPVARLAALAERIGAGDFAARSGLEPRRGEFGRLAHSLDRMAAHLEEHERALAERARALEASNARLREAQKRARLAYWSGETSPNSVLQWSDATAEVLGLPPDKVPRTNAELWSIIHPEDVETVRELVRERAVAGRDVEIEFRLVLPDGRTLWVREIVHENVDPASGDRYSSGTIQDITVQKTQELRIKEQRDRLRAMQRQASIAFWTYEPGRDRVHWSEGAAEVLGLRPEELPRGRVAWFEIIHPEDRERGRSLHDLIAADAKPYETEYRIVRPDGTSIWIREYGSPETDPASGQRLMAGTVQNVTLLRSAETERRATEERLMAFLDHAPFVMYVKGLDGRYLVANREHDRVYGLEPGAAIGRRASDFHTGSVAGEIEEHDREVIARKVPVLREREDAGSNEQRHVLAIKFPILDGTGAVAGVGGFDIDLTGQRQTEQKLAQAQKMEAIGQLTGGLAHDFNNIIGVILGNLDLLREHYVDSPGATELVEGAIAAGERASELNRRLLAFARRQPLQAVTVATGDAVASIAEVIGRTVGEQIVVRMQVDPGVWAVRVDPIQLESAILNLAINARDAMPNGGQLTIEAVNVRLDRDQARPHELAPGDYVKISVSDNGTGMTPEVLARAAEPFFTTKGVGKGSGLGLSMVHGFARQSGGYLGIYSEQGVGTTVSLYLPRAASDSAMKRDDGESGEGERGRGETILVVEDNVGMREMVTRQLTDLGYRPTAAADARAALAILTGGATFDLILTDVVMPGGMDGREFAKVVEAMRPGARLLFTSGYTEAAVAGDPTFRGRLLSKPYRRAELAKAIAGALRTAKG
jgi:PAS domain S-box-containing protein